MSRPPAPQLVADADEWDGVRTRAFEFVADVDAGFEECEVVYRRLAGRRGSPRVWEPWVLVAQSAALRRRGVRGYGLYALRTFDGPRETDVGEVKGARIGRYGGVVRAEFANVESDEARAFIEDLARRGHDHLLAMRVNQGRGWAIVDGADGPLPRLHRMNDSRGTGTKANVRFAENGVAFATRNIPAMHWNNATLDSIAHAELLVSYEAGAPGFWRIFRTLGRTRENPVLIDRSHSSGLPLLRLRM